MFTVLCCADLYGEKANLEVVLPSFPASLAVLEDWLYQIFQAESAALFPDVQSQLPFRIASIQWYDDDALRWTELLTLEQLHEYDQLYVFQPQTRYHRDVQQDLPAPRPPLAAAQIEKAVPHIKQRAPASTVYGHSTLDTSGYHAASPRSDDEHHLAPDPHSSIAYARGARRSGDVSPSKVKLMERSRQETSLVERLRQLREEKMALERSIEVEAEQERRQLAAATDAELRRKEEEIWRQRDSLTKAERDFQLLLERKQQILSMHNSRMV